MESGQILIVSEFAISPSYAALAELPLASRDGWHRGLPTFGLFRGGLVGGPPPRRPEVVFLDEGQVVLSCVPLQLSVLSFVRSWSTPRTASWLPQLARPRRVPSGVEP